VGGVGAGDGEVVGEGEGDVVGDGLGAGLEGEATGSGGPCGVGGIHGLAGCDTCVAGLALWRAEPAD
jgi:hypothetical protein